MVDSVLLSQLDKINSGFARPKNVPYSKIKKVGVIGAGLMGHGIAYVSSYNGLEVVLLDKSKELANTGLLKIEKILDVEVSSGKISTKKRDYILDLIETTDDASLFGSCDLIIEAVYENEKLKSDIIKNFTKIINSEVVFSSNTSSIPISQLAKYSSYPANFIGIHFFSPVHKMKLVEIINSKETSTLTLAKAFDFIKIIKKLPIVVNDGPGFFTTRVFMRYIMEGMALLFEGCSAESIELAGKKAGFPVGPLAVSDEIGLQVAYKIRIENKKTLNKRMKDSNGGDWDTILDIMVNEFGRFGRENRKGFYEYPKNSKKYLWAELGERLSLKQNNISQQEMIDRLLFSQVIESLYCYEEGVLNTVIEANVGSIYGWGFPSPGILEFINSFGIKNFIKRSSYLSKIHGNRFNLPSSFKDFGNIEDLFLKNKI